MKAKPCSHLGFSEAVGLFWSAPHAAGPGAKLVVQEGETHKRGEMARNAQLGLQTGEPRKGTDESRTGGVGLGLSALDLCPDLTLGLEGEGSQTIART